MSSTVNNNVTMYMHVSQQHQGGGATATTEYTTHSSHKVYVYLRFSAAAAAMSEFVLSDCLNPDKFSSMAVILQSGYKRLRLSASICKRRILSLPECDENTGRQEVSIQEVVSICM